MQKERKGRQKNFQKAVLSLSCLYPPYPFCAAASLLPGSCWARSRNSIETVAKQLPNREQESRVFITGKNLMEHVSKEKYGGVKVFQAVF